MKLLNILGTVVAVALVAVSGCANATSDAPRQVADTKWQPDVPVSTFTGPEQPRVAVDAAHGNLHTIDDRFRSFADLLRADGYDVASIETEISAAVLRDVDILVISNAVLGGTSADWVLPTPQAFLPAEVEAIEAWVAEGGSLLLIADHMPFPGAVSELAEAFGVMFYNGFAMESRDGTGNMTYRRSSGSLADHAITRGRDDSEAVDHVRTFSGQAFRADRPIEPLFNIPDEWIVLLPEKAWEFDEATPRVSARGLVQGAVLEHHEGRVAVFGEAAMFTTQMVVVDGKEFRAGMNHPEADQNAQFVLNILHWLSHLL